MSEELPELPETVAGFKASFVRDYARSYASQAVLAERERTLRIVRDWFEHDGRLSTVGEEIAAAIREGLKGG